MLGFANRKGQLDADGALGNRRADIGIRCLRGMLDHRWRRWWWGHRRSGPRGRGGLTDGRLDGHRGRCGRRLDGGRGRRRGRSWSRSRGHGNDGWRYHDRDRRLGWSGWRGGGWGLWDRGGRYRCRDGLGNAHRRCGNRCWFRRGRCRGRHRLMRHWVFADRLRRWNDGDMRCWFGSCDRCCHDGRLDRWLAGPIDRRLGDRIGPRWPDVMISPRWIGIMGDATDRQQDQERPDGPWQQP